MITAPKQYRLVVVDDVPEIREILIFLLEETGWFDVVGQAATGPDAIELISRERPDLALVDLDLSGPLDGWDVIGELATRVPETKVVILSGSIDDVASPPDRRALAAAVIEKGITSRELTARLLDVLGSPGTPIHDEVGSQPSPSPRATEPGVADAWLAAVVESSPDAVVGKAVDGTIVSWNHAAERLYGYSAAEAIGRNIAMLVPPDRSDELPWMQSRLAERRVVQDLETTRVRKDGSLVEVLLTISPVLAADGSVLGAATVARDTTHRRYVETTLSRVVAQLERKNRELLRSNDELDSFAAVASHDLSQPLQVAYGFVDMVRSTYGGRLDDDGREWLDHALRGLERLRSLVREILRYSRTGAGEPSQDLVDLGEVVAEALDDLGVVVDDRGASVQVGDLPKVLGQASQLRLVFQNLLSNAIKFVPPGRSPVVTVGAVRAGEDVIVDVVDNGRGIPAEQRAHVFEMFKRAAGADVEGSGVGLAIVKKIVGRHGGAVWAEAGPDGVGTRMRLQLPAERGTRPPK